HRARQPQTQKLTEDEITELKNYLPKWNLAQRSEKRAVFAAIARPARLFVPKLDQRQWKKRKQTWLFNNNKKKERKDMIKYGRKWTPRMVIYQQNRDKVLKRIEDESGAKPGGPGMFKHYQAAVKRVMAELDNDKLAKAKETAEEWQCGMRKNEKGEVLFGMHDDNKALGDGDSFMKMKDWEDIEPVWQEYTQEQFGAGARDGGRQVKGGCKRIRKPPFELEMDGDGMPLLPDITEMKLEEKKAIIVRAFLTSHYRICSGSDKAVVPWSAIVQSQDDFVARKYLPEDDTGEGLTVEFKAWKNKDGDMVASVISGTSTSQQTRKVKKEQRVMIRRPQDSSTKAESDTHQPEDDADDDSADGTAVPRTIPKPRPPKPANTGAMLTSQMGDLLAGLTEEGTGVMEDDVARKDGNTSPAPKSRRGKKAAIEPSAETKR
ncbi:hypothetical protein P692DRAFT_201795693, partial [Suillus brevipes Sb2]